MPKPRPRDLNRLASSIVDAAIAERPLEDKALAAARESGRQGGLKGGRARAAKLTKKRRSEIAKKAARARWSRS
jgi:hypothetical protein